MLYLLLSWMTSSHVSLSSVLDQIVLAPVLPRQILVCTLIRTKITTGLRLLHAVFQSKQLAYPRCYPASWCATVTHDGEW